MSVDENIQLMRRWFQEVWNEGRTQTVHELLAPESVATGQRGAKEVIRGPEEFVQFVHEIRGAFPDIHVEVEDVFGADDKVELRWSGKMTHTGAGPMGPATNRAVHIGGITIVKFRGGKIVTGWDHWDQLGLLEQLGLHQAPELARTA